MRAGREVQAVLLGGAAGTFVTVDELSVALTFEDARKIGATLGSGVVMVFDDAEPLCPILQRIARVLPRRVVRPVRAVPRGHRPPGGAARAPVRAAAYSAPPSDERRLLKRAGAGDARRLDLRARPDRVERDRVGDASCPACAEVPR